MLCDPLCLSNNIIIDIHNTKPGIARIYLIRVKRSLPSCCKVLMNRLF